MCSDNGLFSPEVGNHTLLCPNKQASRQAHMYPHSSPTVGLIQAHPMTVWCFYYGCLLYSQDKELNTIDIHQQIEQRLVCFLAHL